jgi:hypothetical protein
MNVLSGNVWNGLSYGKFLTKYERKSVLLYVVVTPRLWPGIFVYKKQARTRKSIQPSWQSAIKDCLLLTIYRTRRKRVGLLPHIRQRSNRRDIMTPPPEIWLGPPTGYSSGDISNPTHVVTHACGKPTITNHPLCSLLQKSIKRRR